MLKYFVARYKSMKADYLDRTPKGKWLFALNIGIFVLKLIGIPILDPKFKVWWYSCVPGVAFIDGIISFIYTLYYYADTPLRGLLFNALLGIVVPPMMIYVSIFVRSERRALQSLVHFSGSKLYTNVIKESNRKYRIVCERRAVKLLIDTVKMVGIINASNCIVLILAVYAFISMNEIQLPIPVLFPFTDLESRNGLVINAINQLFVCFVGFVGLIGIEIATCVLKDSLNIIAASICYSIDEMSEKIMQDDTDNEVCIDQHFRNIIIQVQDFDRWILKLLRIFYWRLLTQPILLSFDVVFALFFYLHGIWMSGLGIVLSSYAQLYIQCDYGDTVKTCNEILVRKLQDMPWYMMSKKSKLAYVHLLRRMQDGAVFQMRPFDPLNFETLSNMTKRIYTFLMILLRMQ